MKNLEYDLMEFIKFLGDTDKYKQRLEDIERSKESVTTEKNLASAERQQAMEAQADLDKKIKYYESLKQEVEAKQSSASRLLKAVEEKGSALKSKEKELDEKESNLIRYLFNPLRILFLDGLQRPRPVGAGLPER